MLSLPSAFQDFLMSFSVAFTAPSFPRMLAVCVGLVLARGRSTVTEALRTLRGVAEGHFSDYHRLFSRAPWSLWSLGRILVTQVLALIPEDEPVTIVMDDTTAQHKGKRVYGKGCHHDAVRSAHAKIVHVWGHKWVVLAVSVRFSFASRPWALPVLVALYRPRELNAAEGRRHKTPAELARGLMTVLMRWFPGRCFIFLGDGGYASHNLAHAAARHKRMHLVSRLHPEANLYAPPTKRKNPRGGRPRLKGKKLPSPRDVVKRRRLRTASVAWYGGGTRSVGLVCGTGHWYKAGQGLVPIRWVYVKDKGGTHRDEWFYTTDLSMTPERIVSLYTERWSLEVTFQETKGRLGLETTRQWKASSVLRTGPLLLGLYSVVALLYARLHRDAPERTCPRQESWYAKGESTFADALEAVRRELWAESVFTTAGFHRGFQNLQTDLKETLLEQLSRAA
jgi:hypothetical protein